MKPCKKSKVLFILPTLGAGGAERITITLMNNLDAEKFERVFLTLNDDGPIRSWIADDVQFHSFENRTVKSSVFKLVKFIKRENPDVIFTTMVHSNALALLMKILFPRIRVIVREAALPSVLISRYGFKGRLCIFVYKLLYGHADLVLSNCSQMIGDFQTKIKIRTHNHRVLFNPVDTQRVFATLPSVFTPFDGRENTKCFVGVGRLSYEKGYDRLFEALAHADLGGSWRLDLIGEGAYRTELELLISKFNLQDRVFLLGYKSNPWEYAAQADCLVLPSRWEGMPNVVLEGFSCGIPAIASREAGGIIDIQTQCPADILTIVDTMDEFIAAMKNVEITPKTAKAESILPAAFSLPRVMEIFQKDLVGA